MKNTLFFLLVSFLLFSCSDSKDSKKAEVVDSTSLSESDLKEENIKGKVKILTESLYYPDVSSTENYLQGKKGKLENTTIFNYNEKGQIINLAFEIPKENFKEKTVYQYDDSGNKMGWIVYDKGEKIISKLSYMYDKEGNKSKMIKLDNKNKTTEIREFKYDNKKRRTEIIIYNEKSEKISSYHHKYDSLGRLSITESITQNEEGPSKLLFNYRYNKNGDAIELTIGSNDSTKYLYNYEYDNNGNWTSKKEYKVENSEDRDPTAPAEMLESIKERVIEYYE